jgi:hypothetical protein
VCAKGKMVFCIHQMVRQNCQEWQHKSPSAWLGV